MKTLIYDNKEIKMPSELMVERLRVLLPYWGMHLVGDTISPALVGKKVNIIGLSDKAIKDIHTNLAHTGVTLTSTSEHLTITISVSSNYSSPLTLKDNDTIHHLTPIHLHYAPVQMFIHKDIWLSSTHSSFDLFVHTNLAKNIPEYVSYLLLQYFLREQFEKLNFPFPQYELIVRHVLTTINSTFSQSQQLEKVQTGKSATRKQSSLYENSEKIVEENEGSVEVTMNPFPHDDHEESSSIFDPFRKK